MFWVHTVILCFVNHKYPGVGSLSTTTLSCNHKNLLEPHEKGQQEIESMESLAAKCELYVKNLVHVFWMIATQICLFENSTPKFDGWIIMFLVKIAINGAWVTHMHTILNIMLLVPYPRCTSIIFPSISKISLVSTSISPIIPLKNMSHLLPERLRLHTGRPFWRRMWQTIIKGLRFFAPKPCLYWGKSDSPAWDCQFKDI